MSTNEAFSALDCDTTNNPHSIPTNPIDPINMDKSVGSFCDANQSNLNHSTLQTQLLSLRVMSKQKWNQYKNRYLKIQKTALSTMQTLPCYDQNVIHSVKASFDLSHKIPSTSCYMNPQERNSRICEQSNPIQAGASATPANDKHGQGKTSNTGFIVQINLLTSNAQAIDSTKIKKSLRSLFEQQSALDSSQLPTLSEIAFIDVSDRRIEFKPDGSLKMKCYIRTNQLMSANKLTGEEFRKHLTELLGNNVQLENVALLDEHEFQLYWSSVNQSKQNNNRRFK